MDTRTDSEQTLLSDCTCPVCCDVFVQPQRLKCGHTLCRKCTNKMMQQSEEETIMEINPLEMFSMFPFPRMRKVSQSKRSMRCPICRLECDKSEPDETTESLVQVLRLLRSSRSCQASGDCLAEAGVSCLCCGKRLCQAHHDAQLAAVRTAGMGLRQGIRALLDGPGPEQLGRLQAASDEAPQLQAGLAERLELGMAEFHRQLALTRAQLESPTVDDAEMRAALEADAEAADSLLAGSDLAGLTRLLPRATERLKAAQRSCPQRNLELNFQPEQLTRGLGDLLQGLSAGTYRSPYAQLPPVLTKVQARGLTQKPWDICILSNLNGVVCVKGALKLASDAEGSQLRGPLLVINAQSFPTKMLHVTDMEVKQVATVKPNFGPEGMPGRMHICNERQLILASDAGRHKVFVFNLEGCLLASFGEKGSGPRQFHAPLGICASNGRMFVVDSKNNRVQVFDMDQDYSLVATVEHPSFSEGIHSVLADAASIFVVDRNRSRLFVFDRETRAPIIQPVQLDGKPFDIVPDEFGNALVTLVEEGKVQIVHRLGVSKTFGFKETHENPGMNQAHQIFPLMMMSSPPRMFHGAAFEQNSRRLFIADLMRSCILVADL